MALGVAIETGTTGLWYGRFIDYIGTHARATSRMSLLKELAEERSFHISWLLKHNEPVTYPDEAFLVVQEEVAGIEELGESGGEVALFNFDLREVNSILLEKSIKLMGFNREDLLGEVQGLSGEVLSYFPPGKRRNILQILSHIASAEEFYISRLGPVADVIYEENLGTTQEEADSLQPMERLEKVRKAAVRTLIEVIPLKGNDVFTREDYTSYPEEKWTAHKVMRRFLEHEREHIYNIREYLGKPPRDDYTP